MCDCPTPRLELFPFRYRHPLTGKWVRARYVAERHVIAASYIEWEVTGAPQVREWSEDARYFNPYRDEGSGESVPPMGRFPTVAPATNLGPIIEFAGMVLRPRRRSPHCRRNRITCRAADL